MSRRLLIISHTYRPDPAAAGQYMADVAEEMVRRGWHVTVLTASRGYDNPAMRYPAREVIAGVHVQRVPFSSFGKGSIARRMAASALLVIQSLIRALFMRRIDAALIGTGPPIAPMAAIALRAIRGVPFMYWVMDVNPDQFLALGYAKRTDVVVRILERMNRSVLRAARGVVVLDHFMAERMTRKLDISNKRRIIPPWSRSEHLTPVAHEHNAFRLRNGLDGKFVVMYSGNHGPSAPLDTVLAAARLLRDDSRFAFVFVGGGVAKREVDSAASENPNVISLPYQPLELLSQSLSAADVHVVCVSPDLVGIVHQSRVYGAFAVARPVLVIGPAESPAGEIVTDNAVGWQVPQGDSNGVADLLLSLVTSHSAAVSAAGARAKALSEQRFSTTALRGDLCDFMEASFAGGIGKQ